MSEGGENMPGPEQRPAAGPEQTIHNYQHAFEDNIRDLIETQVIKSEQGEEVTKLPLIDDENLIRLAKQALAFGGRTPEGLTQIIDKGNSLCIDGVVKEEDGGWAQWGDLVIELREHRDFLLRKRQSNERAVSISRPVESDRALNRVDELLNKILLTQEGVLESNRVVGENSGVLMQNLVGYTETMRGVYSQLLPEEEKERWVDAELQQDFYTRFQPNHEPGFYTHMKSSERREWDARWQLARAAFWKKVYSAQPEDLSRNQDLVELTTEQMELLYNIEGVREGLEWYTKAILEKIDIYEEGWEEETGEPKGIRKEKSLVECESGREFEIFRENLQYSLKRKVLGVTKEQEESWIEKERKGDQDARDKLRNLRIRIKSADAIAWDFVWISNFIESVDSRYSLLGDESLRRRHGRLAAAVCSDDLRAVFHPQEKFEDKCLGGQEWGCYGAWGKMQLDLISDKFGEREEKNTVFEPAKFLRDFWRAKEGANKIMVPECYPVASMFSFWETYREGERKNDPSLLSKLVNGERIDWSKTRADPWKTNYLTVLLPKAIGLSNIFKNGKIDPGWTKDLLDIFVRLGTERKLKDYYTDLYGGDVNRGENLGSRHFHNLKVWAYFAPFGGVGRPQDKKPTDPFSDTRVRIGSKIELSDREYILKKPRSRYLDQRERLAINDIA